MECENPGGGAGQVLRPDVHRGRVALVTGGGTGIGRAIALDMARCGADVVISGRRSEPLEKTAAEIEALGARALVVLADIREEQQVTDLVDRALDTFGRIDILVNNAGINIRGAVEDLAEADWDAVIDVNLKAPFLCARAVGAGMRARGWGRVINLGSILSVIAIPGRAPYASAKAGVVNLTRVLALEWATSGVTVNAICPGPFATEMNRQLLNDPVKYKAFVEKIPMGRWGELHEITGAALFLASDAASFVTGSALFVDGGWTAQ